MYLGDMSDVILENVEKLIPHLVRHVQDLLKKKMGPDLRYLPIYQVFGARDIKEMIDWALRADPRFLKDMRKKKPLDKSKSPFVKNILDWWLDPEAGGDIELPEDIQTTAEVLQAYNRAKHKGLNTDISAFKRFSDLVSVVEQYVEEEPQDNYSDMGLELVFSAGPWKMYKIQDWIPGESSSLYPGESCHRAMVGTHWCVKYHGTFHSTYDRPYYMVLHNRKRFALINFPSLQYKNTQDRPISSTNKEAGGEFLKLLFSSHPEFVRILALGMLTKRYAKYSDFAPYSNLYSEQMRGILNTPEIKADAIEMGVQAVYALAKEVGEWPHFRGWPEGKAAIQQGDFARHGDILHDYVSLVGRDPELEKHLDPIYISKYARWLGESRKLDENDIEEVAAAGRQSALKSIATSAETHDSQAVVRSLREGISWLAAETSMRHHATHWPELEQAILDAGDPRVAVGYVRSARLSRWPEAERLIGTDPRAIKAYQRVSGVQVAETGIEAPDMTTPASIVKYAQATGTEQEDKEDIILQDLDAAIDYAEHVIGPWPELEEELASRGTPDQQNRYSVRVLMA